jgi:biopolymer transport protein ExbB
MKSMKVRNGSIFLLTVGCVLASCTLALGAEMVRAPRSVFNMFYVSTFTNFFGFLDHLVIWTCSMLSIALIIRHSLSIRRDIQVPELSIAQIHTMFEERRFREALEFCQTDPSFVSSVVHAGLIQAANGYEAMEQSMQDAANERTATLYRKVEWLNMIGNVTPMMGLTGTIWGMMTAFSEIEAKGGKANPSDLAGGILIALVSTFSGLLTAVPALVAYGVFRGKVEQLAMQASLVAEELLANFKPTASS